jgi:chromosome segregation ATPase
VKGDARGYGYGEPNLRPYDWDAHLFCKVKIEAMPKELLICAESEDYTPQQELMTYVQRISEIANELHVQFVRAERLSTQIASLQRRAIVDEQTSRARARSAYRFDVLEHELARLHEQRESSKAKIEELQTEFAFTQFIIDAILKDVSDQSCATYEP